MSGLDNSELESLLGESHSGRLSRGDPMNYLQSLLVNPAPRSDVHFDAQLSLSARAAADVRYGRPLVPAGRDNTLGTN